MPIYDFRCRSCGTEFEKLVRGDTAVACPKCEATKVERLMSLPARPASSGGSPDFSRLGPPAGGGGCCGGSCHSHTH
ncbi:MAG TPA: zinc ribbon domain-containing protein [Gemmatimonadales bacterium]|nr:zinc ribbon domain-containing protein [Gemmatimonadales bacterium]